MRGRNGQVWVTSVVTNEEVGNALVLGCSLKRAFTSRTLAVIVSSNVDGKLRQRLNYVFDLVFSVENQNFNNLEEDELAKLTAVISLRNFERAVYLAPTILVVKNVDRIFERYGTEEGEEMFLAPDGSLTMFFFKPSLNLHKEIVEGLLQSGQKRNLSSYMKMWIEEQDRSKVKRGGLLEEVYIQDLKRGSVLLGNRKKILFFNFAEADRMEGWSHVDVDKFDMITKSVVQYWHQIYGEDVKDLMISEPMVRTLVVPKSIPYYKNEPIAIVGMSCRFPGSNNLDEFWNLLVNGRDGTSTPPPFRWLREQSSKNRPDCRKTNAGFLNVSVDEFDAKFFGVSPKEALSMDPQHRLLYEVVWEGLEDACINAQELKGTPGAVFIGSWTNDYRDILSHSGNDEFYRTYMGNSIGAAAARISHLLEMVGPSVATESGCSSAMVAVHMACRSLQLGETNMALACGVNLLLHPFDKDVLPMIVSPEGLSKAFCEKADGFARAEGCGVLVLKRLSDAARDNDNIWAMIRGSAMTQEGISKSMGTPTVHCESLAMIGALRDAQVRPEEVSYVEAHGTETKMGDPMEVAAITKAYNSSLREEPLLIGSVKTNVGHTESCSGITGMIKVALAMQHEIIPPHRNFEKLNPAIDLTALPARIPLEPVAWTSKPGKTRIAGVSSFGITGTDAHVIMEESPRALTENLLDFETGFERPLHLLKISAKSGEALDILLEKYQRKIGTAGETLADIAYSGNVGRADFEHRAVIIAKSKEELVANIIQQQFLKGVATSKDVGKICFLFTGQGSQYPGMAKKLYETSPVFRMHFDLCENILREIYSIDIKQALWGTASQDISRTIYSQTSIFYVEYALLKLWESWGIRPDYVLGHSLGEFAAAVCSGILSVEDAVKLVAERSQLIDKLPRGKMLVIKADKNRVSNAMNQFGKEMDYAAINSSEQTVVAGDSEVILEFSQFCLNNGIKSIVLEATHAFHSKHMDPILEEYGRIASTIKPGSETNCKYISGMKGGCTAAKEINAEYWMQHTREKVSFLEASKEAVELGCRIFIEIGPQPILSALTMLNNDIPLACLPSLKKTEQEWDTMLNSLGKLYLEGIPIDWEGLDQFYPRNKVRLPSYPFIRKTFWPDLFTVKGASIHPLLGSSIPNASSTKLFQCDLNLSTHEYMRDHAIGDNVIVPGAGYLEMCLAAGLATVENEVDSLRIPTRPMKVEGLIIEAPLALQESKTVQVQTVVELNTSSISSDWSDMSINIFQRVNGDCSSLSWLSHARATFSPVPSAEEQQISFDLADFRQTLQRESDDEEIIQMQQKLAAVGLRFGPAFRRLERVWKSGGGSTLLAKVSMPSQAEGQQCDYIIHPAVLDAMIQSILFSRLGSNTVRKKLFVPIKIGKFVWLSGNETEETYIYAYDMEPNGKMDYLSTATCAALLVDGNGKVMAIMSGVELIDTTVKAIEAVLEQHTTSMADLWEEVWRPKLGPNQHRADLEQYNSSKIYDDEGFKQDMLQRYNILDDTLQTIFDSTERLVYCYMLRALYELGWTPSLPGTWLSQKGLAAELGIHEDHLQFFGYILQVLEDEGFLKHGADPDKWEVTGKPLTLDEISAELESQALRDLPKKFNATRLMSNLGKHLSQILKGTQSPLPILFPDGPSTTHPSTADFYEEYGMMFKIVEAGAAAASAGVKHWKLQQEGSGNRAVFRILEIGGGTGVFTRHFLSILEEFQIEFEYTFTDISAAFFPPAQKMFERWGDAIQYKKLNIEEDPLSQGFIPGYYDYACASDVIHATSYVREALRIVRSMLKPFANFTMQETTRVHRFLTYSYGLLEGFWRFTDKGLRPSHCTLSVEGWAGAFESTGFEVTGVFPSVNSYHSFLTTRTTSEEKCTLASSKKVWLLFHHERSPTSKFLLEKIPHLTNRQVLAVLSGEKFTSFKGGFTVRKSSEQDFISLMEGMEGEEVEVEGIIYCWSLDGNAVSQDDILQPYFYLSKSLEKLKQGSSPRLLALTDGVVPLEDNDLSHCSTSTIWGFTKTLRNENIGLNCRVIDIGGEEGEPELMMQTFYEIWKEGSETQVAYSGATRFIPKFQPLKAGMADLKLARGTDRFKLVLPETKSIQDLQFGPLEPYVLGEEEVEIHVKVSALNFKDVLNVLKPSEEFKDSNAVGFDFAGLVKRVGHKVTKWSVGDEVFGMNVNGDPLPSHVKLSQDDVLPLPEGMTLCEAATLPAVFATSYHCLIEVAKITSKDTVLIHTASGGVGLSAIQLCKHIGAKMICTAGSKRKQNYLRSLGIEHIFHSRNTKYGEQILELTGGRGVDVVLNSLTSEGFKEASLMACAKGARFVEMSKLSIWQPEDVKTLRPDSISNSIQILGLLYYSAISCNTAIVLPAITHPFGGITINYNYY